MNERSMELLQYNKIIQKLQEFAISDLAKERITNLSPTSNVNNIKAWMRETTEAKKIINCNIPLKNITGIKTIKDKITKQMMLSIGDFSFISDLLQSINEFKNFILQKNIESEIITKKIDNFCDLEELIQKINKSIKCGIIDDKASMRIAKIRKNKKILEQRIKEKLNIIIKSDKYKNYIQSSIISIRNGKYTLSVKREYKKFIEGNIIDKSNSGSTLFISPSEISKLQENLNECIMKEEEEKAYILSQLTDCVKENQRELIKNIETVAYFDFIFAKAKFSREIEGNEVNINQNNYIHIVKGKHPLIGRKAIPLDFVLGQENKALIITGPNTGGKTVVLKTVGLLTMMVQSGLHIPASEESNIAIFSDILVDIGDGQDIQSSLSTFSSHIKSIVEILNKTDDKTLVIIDEIGSGTDPGEGRGIAEAVFEKIYSKGSMLIATTHYSEIKQFAGNHKGFINGAMEFDINTLKPLYKLTIGKTGESNAFLIALRLGMDESIIERAHEITYNEKKDYSKYRWGDSI